MATEWTTEQVAAQCRLDVQRAFETENAEYRAWEAAQLAEIQARPGYADSLAASPQHVDAMAVRDSFMWEIYARSKIDITNNSVTVILPTGFAIHTDLVEMFGADSVSWCTPSIGASIIDGEARVIIKLILIDYWDDDRAAEWASVQAQKPARTYWPIDSEDRP